MTSKWHRSDVDTTSPRRMDVSTTSFQHRVPAGIMTASNDKEP